MPRKGSRASNFDDEIDDGLEGLRLRPIHPQKQESASDAPLLHHEDNSTQSEIGVFGTTPHNSHAQRQRRGKYAAVPDSDVVEEAGHDRKQPEATTSHEWSDNRPRWKPYSLRWPALLSTLIIALVLGMLVIFLLVYSTVHDGLGDDDGTSVVLFGWRFAPTLITVLYAILTAIIFKDARRTEAFARMSHESGSSSTSSLFMKPGQWWVILIDSFQRRENHGRINYFLLSTVLVNVISFLLINPLSSALLQSQPVELISQVPFSRYEVSETEPINMAGNDIVYFRTIGNILQNLTTSAWLTDKYAVVPFSPSSRAIDLGVAATKKPQTWQANTTVLSIDLDCEAMDIRRAIWFENSTKNGVTYYRSLLLSDSGGCEAGISGYNQYMAYYGGGSWFSPPHVVSTVWDDNDSSRYYNSTQACADRQVILSTNGTWQGARSDTWNDGFKAAAWSCQSSFYVAEMPVTTTTGISGTVVDVDDSLFAAQRSLVSPRILDQTRFETAFLARNWTSMIYSPDIDAVPNFGGASALLAAAYDLDPISMIQDGALGETARRIKQRFLGEMMVASISANTASLQTGQVTESPRRVVVNLPIAVSLAVLFIVAAGLTAVALFVSKQRPLNLYNDPASVAAVVKLIEGNSVLRDCFKPQDASRGDAGHTLDNTTHYLRDGLLLSVKTVEDQPEDIPSPTETPRDWRPFAVRRLGGSLLLLLLTAMLAAILTLYVLARTTGLYESAFTYQTNLLSSRSSLFTFAPYSIVPTFLAVLVGLWWDSLDETFRRLQPYVTMAQKPVPATPNIGLSYVATHPLGSMVKAARNSHWLVALVSAGAVLAQVLTVSMSALWQRADGSRPGDIGLVRTLEPRTQPFVYVYAVGSSMGGGDPEGQNILSSFYGDLSTNWLYSATLQLAYNGSEPVWSSDGWSFVPVNLTSIRDSQMYQDTPSSSTNGTGGSVKSVNVTLITPALRATADCSALDSTTNLSSWTTEWDLTDPGVWNVSTNPTSLKKGIEVNKEYELGASAALSTTPILSRARTIVCCANSSGDGHDSAAIGYWSNNYGQGLQYDFETSSGPYPRNFTMKWIKGNALQDDYYMNSTYAESETMESHDFRHLIWREGPTMTALNCRPRIEWANASVTVDMSTGRVWKYSVVDAPKTVGWPWTDVYQSHSYTQPGDGVDKGVIHDQVTVSPGVLFQDALMFAADLQKFWPAGGASYIHTENLDDKNFNFRLPPQGLNVDLMSYSMYQLAHGDMDVLMDPSQMEQLGQRVLATFFQHFISSNVSASGGWGFQQIGATLPGDLGNITHDVLNPGDYQDQNTTLTSDTNAPAYVEIAVEVLQMSPVAVYISMIILLILSLVTLLVYLVGYRHLRKLRYDFDDLASVISVVYDSTKLQRWVQDHPDPKDWTRRTADGQVPRVQLGPFPGSTGQEIWGIEVVDTEQRQT
ncbi:hypothetical protein HRR86_003382 [Exophiala dermatitidis]|nr:hypothetical protein HRR73_000615 [Exophiala dermatitidis]KAJ4628487.1 hypothetical protein HRR86_003382 [Exophiala dermatitidis]